MRVPGKDVPVADPSTGSNTTQVGIKIENVRASSKMLRRSSMGLKVDYQRDRGATTQVEKHIANDLKHVNAANGILEQIISRQPISSNERFPALFFEDLIHYYSEQMMACKAKIEELDHSIRISDERTPKSLNVLQDIMQSHYKYLWSVAERIKKQLDAITEEKYLFEHQVCMDAPRRFDEADKMLQRIDGHLVALEAQLGIPPEGAGGATLAIPGAAAPPGSTAPASGGSLFGTPAGGGTAAAGGGLFGAPAAGGGLFGAPASGGAAAGGGLFGAPAGGAAAGGGLFGSPAGAGATGAAGGGLFGAAAPAPAAPAGGGGLFGGLGGGATPGIGGALQAPTANTGKKGRKKKNH